MIPISKSTWVVLILMLTTSLSFLHAQANAEKPSLDKSSIEGQFTYVYQQSSDFEDYKMVKKWWITRLKTHVLDTMKLIEGQLLATQKMMVTKDARIDSLNKALASNNANLGSAMKEKNTLHFLGIPMDKTAYNSILWTIIAGLTAALVIFILMYKRNHVVTNQTRTDLEDVKAEFESFRKRALEREEGIVRKYHNELMHYKTKAGTV
jgi:hypothetical protein